MGIQQHVGGENLITATLWFNLMLHLHPDRWPHFLQEGMIYLSKISLGVYLISWIFDKIVYQVYLIPYVSDITARFKFYPLVAGAVFLASVGSVGAVSDPGWRACWGATNTGIAVILNRL